MTTINKKDIILLLEDIALYLELKGENPFKISAYRKAAQALETDQRSLKEIDDLSAIKGIGQGTQAVIKEYIDNQTSDTLSELKKEVPEGLVPLLNIPGLGGKKLAKLYQELGVTDRESLKEACENHQVQGLAGFGAKTEEKILIGLEELGQQPERFAYDDVRNLKKTIENYLSSITEIKRFSIAGSMRRMRETIKDLDFIIATDQPRRVKEQLLAIPNQVEIIAQGDTKVSVVIQDKYQVGVDFRLVDESAFITTLHHFTGSKNHNVKMRQVAKLRGEKINEYGVEVIDTGEILTFDSEKAFFEHFDLTEIPPEVREDKGEIEAFKEPVSLIEERDIRGDVHMHTTWSDGAESIEEMVELSIARGYEYMAITDHSKFLRVANGLNEKRLRSQREEIERLRNVYPEIKLLAGVEMDIRPDGSLDFEDDFLQEMDYVIAAIHSSFNQSEEEIMRRLENAMENPYVKQIAHPTGRLLGRRDGYKVNMERLLDKAKETNTALELNANPKRFDLSSEWVNKAQEKGVKLVINTDAHNGESLNFMNEGIGVARRGMIKKETVINTFSYEAFMDFISKKEK